MSRRSFGSNMNAIIRLAAQEERARETAMRRQKVAEEHAARFADKQSKAEAKEAARQYVYTRVEDAKSLSDEISLQDEELQTVLRRALDRSPSENLLERKKFEAARFSFADVPTRPPPESDYSAPRLGFFARLMPGAAKKQAGLDRIAANEFNNDLSLYQQQVAARDRAFAEFETSERGRREATEAHNAEIDRFDQDLKLRDHGAVIAYYTKLLSANFNSDVEGGSSQIGYSPESKHLIVDFDLPDIQVVSEEASFKYIKATDRIESILRPLQRRRSLYAELINQVVLKVVDTIFRGGSYDLVDCWTVNGILDTIDPSTGQPVRPCLISVRVTQDTFRSLNLRQVQPEQCLKSLRASVSRSPSELVAVRPITEISMVDPRFIATQDVLSGLDHRTNLMDLTPGEFEGLITNLFASMGLDTRQTRASRDGGVDCVAFDPRREGRYPSEALQTHSRSQRGARPIRNGAERGRIERNSSDDQRVRQSLVRLRQREAVGTARHMLSEHAKIEAKIVVPETWVDQRNDIE